MPDTPEIPAKSELALALASGVSVATWAKANNVPKSTAYEWSKDPEVRREVDFLRRRTLDQAVGRLIKRSKRAADIVFSIAEDAQSESVRLRAARSIFLDGMVVAKFSGLEARMADFEEKLRTEPQNFKRLPPR
jgi:hypothetical protein